MDEPDQSAAGEGPPDFEQRLAKGISGGVPQIYANGFVTGLSPGDIYIVLERNGAPTAVLNLSFTVAKTLSISLGRTIATLEDQTNRQMLTTQDMDSLFSGSNDVEP